MSVLSHEQLGLSGKFWEGPYDCRTILSPASLVIRAAYDHRNPVKAEMVCRPEDYAWSSAREWATGETGVFPLVLGETLPFGMSRDELRTRILRCHGTAQMDSLADAIKPLLECETPETETHHRVELDRLEFGALFAIDGEEGARK